MIPIITAFERSPDRGRGLARDMRVRWALEEAGQPYDVRLLSFEAMKEPAHLALHPFGQIPTYEEGDLALFESGAIVFHVAERHGGLLPREVNARARAITWMFAALNTIEPPILDLQTARFMESDKPWYAQRLPLIEERIRTRLLELSNRLGDADWLDGSFSAGDLLMVAVLLRLKASSVMAEASGWGSFWQSASPSFTADRCRSNRSSGRARASCSRCHASYRPSRAADDSMRTVDQGLPRQQ